MKLLLGSRRVAGSGSDFMRILGLTVSGLEAVTFVLPPVDFLRKAANLSSGISCRFLVRASSWTYTGLFSRNTQSCLFCSFSVFRKVMASEDSKTVMRAVTSVSVAPVSRLLVTFRSSST